MIEEIKNIIGREDVEEIKDLLKYQAKLLESLVENSQIAEPKNPEFVIDQVKEILKENIGGEIGSEILNKVFEKVKLNKDK